METEVFDKAKWIWSNISEKADSYVEFFSNLTVKTIGNFKMRISADSNYSLYINGQFVDSGQYCDFTSYKVYDEIDITKYICLGQNSIAVIVWYYGKYSFTYSVGNPGLIFEIERDNKIILFSDDNVLCRKSKTYISGVNEDITMQLGLNFHIDLTKEDNWIKAPNEDFKKCIVCDDMPKKLYLRPIKKLNIGKVISGEMAYCGYFSYNGDLQNAGAKMQYSSLAFDYPENMRDSENGFFELKTDKYDGMFFVFDIKKESSGFVDFDLDVTEDCQMEIGWGEHLVDGRCRTQIGERNFSATVKLKSGRNSFVNTFRRLGCRYLQIFVHAKSVKINYVGLRPVTYPLNIKKYKSGNLLRDRIYEICQNTLIQCMHEHYEDCPWREQALYTLDSRNQMLCGYYAFGEYQFPRANLILFSKSIKEDGLLTICAPTDEKLKIPSFCLFYIVQLFEYYQYSGDTETIAMCFDVAKTIIDTFIKRIDDTGLAKNFEGKNYWNFYEWRPYLDGRDNNSVKRYDTCLNATLSFALDHFVKLCEAVGEDNSKYSDIKDKLNSAIKEKLFDKNAKLFKIYYRQTDNVFSVLANALCVLCGAADIKNADNIINLLEKKEDESGERNIIAATLSMNTFRYEALLKADRNKYKNFILNEIDGMYLEMLNSGATSFWETRLGAADFHNAGSLCHGWAAMPVYYYETLFSRGE